MSKSMRCLAALDIGGSKAEAVLFREDGTILSHFVMPGGVPFELGVEPALKNALAVVEKLTAMEQKIHALYCSIATVQYYQEIFDKAFAQVFPQLAMIRIEGDGPCLISTEAGHNDGASLICGTGSSLYIRKGDAYHHIGGGGHLVDSCGSGFMLGRLALQAALRASDGSEPPTLLTEVIRQKAGYDVWKDFAAIYDGGRAYIASFAECVFRAREMGDITARRIFNRCASDLSDLIWAACKELGDHYVLILNGGIFRNFPEYAEVIRAQAPKGVRVILSDLPPIYGCAVEAMYDLRLTCDETFRQNFMNSYK